MLLADYLMGVKLQCNQYSMQQPVLLDHDEPKANDISPFSNPFSQRCVQHKTCFANNKCNLEPPDCARPPENSVSSKITLPSKPYATNAHTNKVGYWLKATDRAADGSCNLNSDVHSIKAA